MTVRIYLPLTRDDLARLVAEGRLAGPLPAHAVTDALRAEWPDGDEEGWEYAALSAAADASRALAGAGARRFVVAADVAAVVAVPGDDPTRVEVAADVPWKRVASAHVDVAAGAEDDEDLAWFATQEIAGLLD